MRRLTHMLFVCSLASSALIGGFAHADEQVNAEASRLMLARQAQDSYERGVSLTDLDPEESTLAFSRSADGWRRIITSGVENGRLWTNLGNAELGAGRLGHAIQAFLEADRLLPGDPTVRRNLLFARNQVPAKFEAEGVTVVYDTVSEGWHLLGFETRWWIAAGSWCAFWSLLLVGLQRRRRDEDIRSEARGFGLKTSILITGGVSVLLGSTIALDIVEETWRTPGVLLEETIVRSGNGDSFSEVFSEALPAGVEFEVQDSRPSWHQVRFSDGRSGWIAADDVARIGNS
ncbi:MAG TPA: hypothetical protein DCX60_08685 [Phycisphaerales bacterium]|nr:hypothetical protein [Phycisphaerales bacterium]